MNLSYCCRTEGCFYCWLDERRRPTMAAVFSVVHLRDTDHILTSGFYLPLNYGQFGLQLFLYDSLCFTFSSCDNLICFSCHDDLYSVFVAQAISSFASAEALRSKKLSRLFYIFSNWPILSCYANGRKCKYRWLLCFCICMYL